MKNHPPLRVVTVAFNPGPDLASMAASLENATSSPYELVIVDNGSDPTIVDDVARRFGAGEHTGAVRAGIDGLWLALGLVIVGIVLVIGKAFGKNLSFSEGHDAAATD